MSYHDLSEAHKPLLLFQDTPEGLPLHPDQAYLYDRSSSVRQLFEELQPHHGKYILFLCKY